MWSGDRDELVNVIWEFKSEDPSDETAQVVPDYCNRFQAQSFEKVFQLSAYDARPIIVTQYRLI